MSIYSGECVGGPLAGQRLAWDKRTYQIRTPDFDESEEFRLPGTPESFDTLTYTVSYYVWDELDLVWRHHG